MSVNGNEGTVLLFPQPSRNDRLGEEQSYPETLPKPSSAYGISGVNPCAGTYPSSHIYQGELTLQLRRYHQHLVPHKYQR